MKMPIMRNELNIFNTIPNTSPSIVPMPAFIARCAFLYFKYSPINAPMNIPSILEIIKPTLLPTKAPKTPNQLATHIFVSNIPATKSSTVPMTVRMPVTITMVIVTFSKSVKITYSKIPPHITGTLRITG